MKLFGLIAGSVILGLIVTASLRPPDPERAMYRHFKKLEKAGRDRYKSYGGGL